MNDKDHNCPVCSHPMSLTGEANYYTIQSKFKTPIYFCSDCDLYNRYVNVDQLVTHFYAASYVQPENESKLLNQREGLFQSILEIVSKTLEHHKLEKTNVTLVDFGSAYGHLLEICRESRFNAIGIELNQNMIAHCRQKGLIVYSDLNELTDAVDIFTLIDSLYYIYNPKEILKLIREKLSSNGIMVVRLTNRNLYAKIQNLFKYNKDYSIIGDATISYSVKTAKKLFELTGFEIINIIPDTGKSKKELGWKTRFFYFLTSFFTMLTFNLFVLTPGVIFVARCQK